MFLITTSQGLSELELSEAASFARLYGQVTRVTVLLDTIFKSSPFHASSSSSNVRAVAISNLRSIRRLFILSSKVNSLII